MIEWKHFDFYQRLLTLRKRREKLIFVMKPLLVLILWIFSTIISLTGKKMYCNNLHQSVCVYDCIVLRLPPGYLFTIIWMITLLTFLLCQNVYF